jgi:hypothetical protein
VAGGKILTCICTVLEACWCPELSMDRKVWLLKEVK